MFNKINVENWDRREIFELFKNSSYCLTVEIEITDFIQKIKQNGLKFYPSACWCATSAVNSDKDYRYGILDGKVGYWDSVDPIYTLMRTGTNLFTHGTTDYTDDFFAFYKNFLYDKQQTENCGRLYYKPDAPLNAVHITIMPDTHFSSLSRPASTPDRAPPRSRGFVVSGRAPTDSG